VEKLAEDTFAQLISGEMANKLPAVATQAVVPLIVIADMYFKLRQHADTAATTAVPW
jgi:hypothetical protein